MSVTPAASLAGVLPAVISGGRPALAQRITSRLLPVLHGVTADPVWVVSETDAPGYEPDGHELVTYTRRWAQQYAAAHWTGLTPPERGGFLGAFPGREYACKIAAERGHWAVLQLDDNIAYLYLFRSPGYARKLAMDNGGLALFADLLAAVTRATNGWMTGAQLDSVNPSGRLLVSRPGFPYSLFLERLGPDREPWYGPFEDDITHAYQYGSSATRQTALLVPSLRYRKETSSKTGMRSRYGHERAVPLQRMFPETARVGVRKAYSNGRGGPRVFHTMLAGAIRTPQIITDPELYGQVSARLAGLAGEFAAAAPAHMRDKVTARAGRWPARETQGG